MTTVAVVACAMSACGQTMQGEFPALGSLAGGSLTAREAQLAAEALVRASAERQTSDLADIERRRIASR